MSYITLVVRYKTWIAAAVLFALGVGVLAHVAFSRLTPLAGSPADAPVAGLDAGFDEESAADEADEAADEPEDKVSAAEEPPALVIAYISGAVRAPDVYQLPAGARLKDLVLAAGGLSDDADIERVNLAALVADGEHVIIPWVGMQYIEAVVDNETSDETAPAASDAGGLLDLNRASIAELDELPGIGMTLAGRIVAWRESDGPFQTVDDLSKVEGIGPSVLAKITPLVTVEP